MYKEYSYEEVENYLSGDFSEEEIIQFEKQLEIDEKLKQKVLICQSTPTLILQNKLSNLRTIMSEEQAKADKSKFPFNKTGMLVIVSSVLLSGTAIYVNSEKTISQNIQDTGKNIIQTDTVKVRSTFTQEEKNIHISEGQNIEKTNVAETKESIEKTLRSDTVSKEIKPVTNVRIVDHNQSTDSTTINKPKQDISVLDSNPKSIILKPTETTKSNCDDIEILADISITEPCLGSRDGMIELKNLQGGKSPYKSFINKNEVGYVTVFKDLYQGNYSIDVVDGNGCKHQFNSIILIGKNCNQKYDFNTSQGEVWNGPITNQICTLRIIDKNGTMVFTKQMDKDVQCTWDGYNLTGTLLHGYFVFTIENKDGSVTKGSITITE
ncbi:hypothetical protein [uncultured Cytophaga sp.]|uniref:hypothetical protein n=1 Tax=uncultured Cytophaga sp. TaxID=160238 RepID=UPI002618248A|nr:hypothetical protein [uncultured Cytophaga sp.]